MNWNEIDLIEQPAANMQNITLHRQRKHAVILAYKLQQFALELIHVHIDLTAAFD